MRGFYDHGKREVKVLLNSTGTVADNIRYGPLLQGRKLNDNEVYKLLALADLDSSFYSKSGGELSVGQAQRVALARALANEPEVITYKFFGRLTNLFCYLISCFLQRFCYLMSPQVL